MGTAKKRTTTESKTAKKGKSATKSRVKSATSRRSATVKKAKLVTSRSQEIRDFLKSAKYIILEVSD